MGTVISFHLQTRFGDEPKVTAASGGAGSWSRQSGPGTRLCTTAVSSSPPLCSADWAAVPEATVPTPQCVPGRRGGPLGPGWGTRRSVSFSFPR